MERPRLRKTPRWPTKGPDKAKGGLSIGVVGGGQRASSAATLPRDKCDRYMPGFSKSRFLSILGTLQHFLSLFLCGDGTIHPRGDPCRWCYCRCPL
jgi:hypothetical protein